MLQTGLLVQRQETQLDRTSDTRRTASRHAAHLWMWVFTALASFVSLGFALCCYVHGLGKNPAEGLLAERAVQRTAAEMLAEAKREPTPYEEVETLKNMLLGACTCVGFACVAVACVLLARESVPKSDAAWEAMIAGGEFAKFALSEMANQSSERPHLPWPSPATNRFGYVYARR